MNQDDLLTPDEVARFLGISVHTLAFWRQKSRTTLSFVRIGRCVRYRPGDVQDYLRRQTCGTEVTA
ncbi:MAG: helix-turn-helix domain-containing protein [Candidatus Sericytochromatia bacterium]|nr:helix-turn-helix domain-containing protein [Candidatus Sericytochromatia bacterium]